MQIVDDCFTATLDAGSFENPSVLRAWARVLPVHEGRIKKVVEVEVSRDSMMLRTF